MSHDNPAPARLVLEDGTTFDGHAYGARGTTAAEVVFHTAMSGYTEILTDPSYRGQIVCFSYPLIGNYGVSEHDFESSRFQAEGVIVREGTHSAGVSPDLEPRLAAEGVVGIQGIDTRSLVRRLRDGGVLRGCIDSTGLSASELTDRARALPAITGGDWVDRVTTAEPYDFGADANVASGIAAQPLDGPGIAARPVAGPGIAAQPLDGPDIASNGADAPRIAVLDYGAKRSILRRLAANGARVRVFPARTSREALLAWDPRGVVLSNGPGDPVDVPFAVELARGLIGELPVLGICLGHQILGLAAGLPTFKLPFGHHGGNHPVGDAHTGAVWITSQNHNYCVRFDEQTAARDWDLTLINLNDRTLEGFRHRELPVMTVQFHPEGGPGPHDAYGIFADFMRAVRHGDRAGAVAP